LLIPGGDVLGSELSGLDYAPHCVMLAYFGGVRSALLSSLPVVLAVLDGVAPYVAVRSVSPRGELPVFVAESESRRYAAAGLDSGTAFVRYP